MDPLSVTTSVITLIDAATKVYRLLQSIRHAETELSALRRELHMFLGYLQSIAEALGNSRRRHLALAHIHRELWEQTKIALEDCKATLAGLTRLIQGMNNSAPSSAIFRRTKFAIQMQVHAQDVISFRDKIHMSIFSLQTLLQVITVSVSLRNNASQDLVLRELKHLKQYLRESIDAAMDPRSTRLFGETDNYLAQHLKGLVQAAHEFHSSASTTAGTIYDEEERLDLATDMDSVDMSSSVMSPFPSFRRRRVELFLRDEQPSRLISSSANTNEKSYPKVVEESPHTIDVFDGVVTGGLNKVAQKAIEQLNLKKAEVALRETLKRYRGSGLDDMHHRRLRTKLALTNLLQGKGNEAEGLTFDLTEFGLGNDILTRQILYALAVSYLHDMQFDKARGMCERFWETRQVSNGGRLPSENDILTILAITHRFSGDLLIAEAIEAECPDIVTPQPVPRVVDFIATCDELFIEFSGIQGTSTQEAFEDRRSLGSVGDWHPESSEDEEKEKPKDSDATGIILKHSAINRSLMWFTGQIWPTKSISEPELDSTCLCELMDTSLLSELDGTGVVYNNVLGEHESNLHHPGLVQPTESDDCLTPVTFKYHHTNHCETPETENVISCGLERLQQIKHAEHHRIPQVAPGLISQHQTSSTDLGYESGRSIETTISEINPTQPSQISQARMSKSFDIGDLRRHCLPPGQTIKEVGVAKGRGAINSPVSPDPWPNPQHSSTDSNVFLGVEFPYSALHQTGQTYDFVDPEAIIASFTRNLGKPYWIGCRPQTPDDIQRPVELDSRSITRQQYFYRITGRFVGKDVRPTACMGTL
ncbi:hypothetical protein K449DRAFT_429478 [Hypoxylon sp. EC38]|nr:hypothetical protein K449DRAFT_429478 [Hypoxylon sp. EC38]